MVGYEWQLGIQTAENDEPKSGFRNSESSVMKQSSTTASQVKRIPPFQLETKWTDVLFVVVVYPCMMMYILEVKVNVTHSFFGMIESKQQ